MTEIKKCLFCESEMTEIPKDFAYVKLDGVKKVLKNVPAQYCSGCDQHFYKQEVLDKIDILKKDIESWEEL